MSMIERYRVFYEHEKDSNRKMLAMIESVPAANRGDARFQQAVMLAGHLAACRENWLDRIAGNGVQQVAWFDPDCDRAALADRYEALERRWTHYLARLDDDHLARDFQFSTRSGTRVTLPTEVQVAQLVGHAAYHRGQIALLIDQLGGQTVDTDYLYWASPQSA